MIEKLQGTVKQFSQLQVSMYETLSCTGLASVAALVGAWLPLLLVQLVMP